MDPQTLVSRVENLFSLPEVWTRVNELLEDPHSTTAQMGEVLSPGATLIF